MRSFLTKRLFCTCVVAVLFFCKAAAQINITGRVVDEITNAPIPNSSVFFNNTTIGAYTNAEGMFYFEAVRLINTELVISCAGYEVLAYKPAAAQAEGKKLVFKLHARSGLPVNKPVLTETVRRNCVYIFSKIFLGFTQEASKCTIVNEDNLYFGPGKNSSSFMAYADTPLVIINNMLGYKISFNLEEFHYDDANGESYLFGYTRYDDLNDTKKYSRNRQDCYYGSSLHFYRSLISNQLYEQGYGTFLVKKLSDTANFLRNLNPSIPLLNNMKVEPLSSREILYIDSANELSIRVRGELLVQYNKNPPSKKYLRHTINEIEGDIDKGVESTIIFKAPAVGINYAGVLDDPAAVDYTGYWIYQKAANSLPYDYQP